MVTVQDSHLSTIVTSAGPSCTNAVQMTCLKQPLPLVTGSTAVPICSQCLGDLRALFQHPVEEGVEGGREVEMPRQAGDARLDGGAVGRQYIRH